MPKIFYMVTFSACTVQCPKGNKVANREEDGSLKKHLKQLLILQKQEKGVEDEIIQLKDKIYQKIQQKRSQSEANETSTQSMNNGDSSPFGELDDNQDSMISSESRKSRSLDRNQYRSLVDKNHIVVDDENFELSSIEDLRHLLKMASMSNQTRFIDLKIENHGKQTIILL